MSTACTSDQRRTGAEQETAEVGTGTEQAAAASTAAAPLAGATLTKDTPPPSRTPAPAGRAYLRLVVVLGLLIALGPLTIDMYLPALPQLTEDLRATEPQAQFTLTGIMIGLGLGQLVLGPVSDAVGRRKVLLSGVVVHGLMSVLCALAPSILLLSVVRVGQGVAGAAISVVAMAVVRDLFSGRKAANCSATSPWCSAPPPCWPRAWAGSCSTSPSCAASSGCSAARPSCSSRSPGSA